MSFSQSSNDYPLQHPQIQSSALISSALDDSNNNASTTWAYGEGSYCICGEGYIGRMLACDMEGCDIEWFHFKCVGINKQVRVSYFVSRICFFFKYFAQPDGLWYCPRCIGKTATAGDGKDNHLLSSPKKHLLQPDRELIGSPSAAHVRNEKKRRKLIQPVNQS
jgi:hypothetical protein